MNQRWIIEKVERSSLGTVHARAVRRTVAPTVAAEVVARAEAQRRPDEKASTNLGADGQVSTYT
jgi:hypothetical protein